MVIKRVGPLSVAKIAMALYGLLGLVTGLLLAAGGTIVTRLTGVEFHNPLVGYGFDMSLGVLIVLLPIVYGVGGFIFGFLGAAIYNAVSTIVGGIEIDVAGPIQ